MKLQRLRNEFQYKSINRNKKMFFVTLAFSLQNVSVEHNLSECDHNYKHYCL